MGPETRLENQLTVRELEKLPDLLQGNLGHWFSVDGNNVKLLDGRNIQIGADVAIGDAACVIERHFGDSTYDRVETFAISPSGVVLHASARIWSEETDSDGMLHSGIRTDSAPEPTLAVWLFRRLGDSARIDEAIAII